LQADMFLRADSRGIGEVVDQNNDQEVQLHDHRALCPVR
jgi:hypothetical protein